MSGLEDEIRAVVEPQVPTTVDTAPIIARIQQGVLERSKFKYQRSNTATRHNTPQKVESRQQPTPNPLWRDRQLRDYRKANGLCYNCGEKFEPGHNEVCAKRVKAQANALVVNGLDRELSDDVLNQQALEDALPAEFCQLSINAISSTDHMNCIKLKTKVKDRVMLILIDSASSHSFVSSKSVQLAGLPTVSMPPRKVKLENGEWLVTDKQVLNL